MTTDPASRRHGRIDLDWLACTSCMACVRECPVWCIELTAHPEVDQTGGRVRKTLVLDTFAIDYGLCMYCGICIDVCPLAALAWNSAPAVDVT